MEHRHIKVPFWRSIQTKFALSYLVLMVVALLVLNIYPIITSQDLVFKTKQTSLQSQASLISSTIAPLEVLTSEGVTQVMGMLDENQISRIIITDCDGLVLYDTEETPGSAPRYALLQEITQALSGRDVFYSTYHSGAFRSSCASPVLYRNAMIGAVYLYEFDSEQGVIITGLQQNLLRISLFMLGISLIIGILLSRMITRRISRLITGIGELEAGEYSTRVQVSGKDELATLAVAFNDLTERLEETDAVRKRFVSDASHELKTPLASIKLLTDSIVQNEDMDVETIRDFVQDIGTEADRLTRITEKLLSLTRMDNGSTAPKSVVDLSDVMSSALHMLMPLADHRNVTIHVELDEGCLVRSSEDEIYQVLFNLVENAIKYNVQGGKIWIRTEKQNSLVLICIEDTGIGIPAEEKDKIFDRFYRVDKARSRQAGGTGLGLSIVRDTVVNNCGTIEVADRNGGGTAFTVHLPLAQPEQEGEQ